MMFCLSLSLLLLLFLLGRCSSLKVGIIISSMNENRVEPNLKEGFGRAERENIFNDSIR